MARLFEGSRRGRGENATDVRDNVRPDNDNRKGRGGPQPLSGSERTQGVVRSSPLCCACTRRRSCTCRWRTARDAVCVDSQRDAGVQLARTQVGHELLHLRVRERARHWKPKTIISRGPSSASEGEKKREGRRERQTDRQREREVSLTIKK
jgi:hypothetical protein